MRAMHTLRDLWNLLKPLLEAAMKSKPAEGSHTDPKKIAGEALQKFTPVMAELEKIYKLKAQVDEQLRKAAEKGMNILTPAWKATQNDDFSSDKQSAKDLNDKLGLMINDLKELKSYGTQVQWV